MKKVLLIVLGVIIVVIGAGAIAVTMLMKDTPPETLEQAYLTDNDRFVTVAGARVRVREQGPADGQPVILLHGFTFSLESFDAWAEGLSDDYRVIRYDLLGHGLTGPDAEQRYSPTERAAFLGEVMDALEIDSAVVGGNSLGGLVAWRFAADNPARVDKLILVDAAAYSINGVTEEPAEIPAAMKAFLLTVPDAGVEATVNLVYGDPQNADAERKQLLGDMMRREGNGEAAIAHLEEFTLPDPAADLARVEMPTLILWGGRDRMIPLDQAYALSEAIPNASLVVHDELGHVPQEEGPERTLADVREFLEEETQ